MHAGSSISQVKDEGETGMATDPLKTPVTEKYLSSASSTSGQDRNAKTASIKNKLKSLEEEGHNLKKQRVANNTSLSHVSHSSDRIPKLANW